METERDVSFTIVTWRDGTQLAVIAMMAALGATLIVVGALSGVALMIVAGIWFLYLYRRAE